MVCCAVLHVLNLPEFPFVYDTTLLLISHMLLSIVRLYPMNVYSHHATAITAWKLQWCLYLAIKSDSFISMHGLGDGMMMSLVL